MSENHLQVVFSITTCVITAFVVLALTPLLATFLQKRHLYKMPTTDRWHTTPTVSFGGIAMFLGCCAGLLLSPYSLGILPVIGVSILFAGGIIDDIMRLSPRLKLLFQYFAAVVIVSGGLVFHLAESEVLNQVITATWIVFVVNAVNLSDSMDGLSSGLSAISAFFIGVISLSISSGEGALAASLTFGASLGFLRFNKSPARIFMGDCGAHLLGSLIAISAIYTANVTEHLYHGAWFATVCVGFPIIDTSFVILRRLFHKQNIFQGGKDHLPYIMVYHGYSESSVIGILYFAQIVLITVSLFLIFRL
ncbi:MAG: undecaprenyl/decaprenyl-phosphate alpha-N-acetylglucosaminyl 1-phosphate transferase [Ignavibacteria bacterium]|nr:undecaprenyl/decaprenyl-phosphate alpha-N-acetylglucosaminyl 1-phosphate transferase [Ignavibacteria bacterium]